MRSVNADESLLGRALMVVVFVSLMERWMLKNDETKGVSQCNCAGDRKSNLDLRH